MCRRRWLVLATSICQIVLICAGLAACAEEYASNIVTLRPGADIQNEIEKAPPGSKFLLEPGIYRQRRIKPKDGQEFIGKSETIITGAQLLTDWRIDESSKYWIATGAPPQLRPAGKCKRGGELCRFREDLFVDGKLYSRVGSIDDLGPGKWLFQDEKAYLAEDPTGKAVEISVAPVAFSGRGKNVVLRNLVVEKFASAAQFGAIDARRGVGWKVIDVTVRWSHGVGIYMGPEMQILRGAVVNNGQLGIGGQANNGVVDGVEIAHNNFAGFSVGWEAGGTKFVRTENLVVRNACVHHNNGPGLWTDIDNVNIIYEGNKVFQNSADGIKHEISYDAIIRNNEVAGNGYGYHTWLWGSQILIQNSQDVEVYGNTVVVGAGGGNGISIINQDRGTGKLGPFVAKNNRVEDNTIIHLGDRGRNGIVVDFDEKEFWQDNSNQFDRNKYIGVSPKRSFWMMNNGTKKWNYVRAHGMEKAGTLVRARRPVPKLSCD